MKKRKKARKRVTMVQLMSLPKRELLKYKLTLNEQKFADFRRGEYK